MRYELRFDNGMHVEVDTLGGELKSLKYCGDEILWDGRSAAFPVTSPNLFPFIGRLYGSKYLYEGKEFPMNIHGFLAGSPMEIVQKNENELKMFLRDNEETRKCFPFSFYLEIKYIIIGKTLSVQYLVQSNEKERDMRFSIGGHPGFLLDLSGGKAFEDYYIEFTDQCIPFRYHWDNDGLLKDITPFNELVEGKKLLLDKELFRNDAIVLSETPGALKIKCKKNDRTVTVCYKDFPLVGIWHPYGSDDPFICIEPWYGHPGRGGIVENLEEKPYTILLHPTEKTELGWSVTIDEK